MDTKQLKEAIRDALVPHLAGIRHDLADSEAGAMKRADQMAEAVTKALLGLAESVTGSSAALADALKALVDKAPAPVEVTQRIEITIEGADSASFLEDGLEARLASLENRNEGEAA